ncbi:hypothetical protein BH20ACT2_BH20ACT2_17560 [soil metagenome]
MELVVEADGSGWVTVEVVLDAAAAAEVPDLDDALRVDDLGDGGWEVSGPEAVAAGSADSGADGGDDGVRIVARKRFATPAGAGQVLAEVAGPDGPFRDFEVERTGGFGRSTTTFRGVADLSGGLAAFGDTELTALLGGEPLGFTVDQLEERAGGELADAVGFRVVVQLPGPVDSNAPVETGSTATWSPDLGDPEPLVLEASSRDLNVVALVLAGGALLSGLALVLVVARLLGLRRPRRRSSEAIVSTPPEG